ncbi:phasin family protein [Rhizobium sp. L80/93]|uniref:phasin family protein n=1 Tax=Rhizobium sp. E27B/91 TaxID=2819995 RepID=UPI001FFE0D0B|nr:phasin family protein [Rhizobium sp. E27B/91]
MLNDNQNAAPDTDAIDEALKNYTQAALSVQAIAAEAAGYSKKSFEDAVSHVGTLSSVTSLDAALELQSNFAKSYYEGFVPRRRRSVRCTPVLPSRYTTPPGKLLPDQVVTPGIRPMEPPDCGDVRRPPSLFRRPVVQRAPVSCIFVRAPSLFSGDF